MILLLVQLLLLSPVFAAWNGYVILWGVNTTHPNRKKWSQTWHMLGWIVRFQIALLIAYVIYWQQGLDIITIAQWELLYIGIASIGYDLIINVIRYLAVGAPPINYIDQKGINKFLTQLFGGETQYWIARLLYIIGVTLWIILS